MSDLKKQILLMDHEAAQRTFQKTVTKTFNVMSEVFQSPDKVAWEMKQDAATIDGSLPFRVLAEEPRVYGPYREGVAGLIGELQNTAKEALEAAKALNKTHEALQEAGFEIPEAKFTVNVRTRDKSNEPNA